MSLRTSERSERVRTVTAYKRSEDDYDHWIYHGRHVRSGMEEGPELQDCFKGEGGWLDVLAVRSDPSAR
jgi:hypothetical protein